MQQEALRTPDGLPMLAGGGCGGLAASPAPPRTSESALLNVRVLEAGPRGGSEGETTHVIGAQLPLFPAGPVRPAVRAPVDEFRSRLGRRSA